MYFSSDEESFKHIKKKNKKNSKSNHKHEYIKCIFIENNNVDNYVKGSYCKHCGKVRDYIWITFTEHDDFETYCRKHSDYPIIYLSDSWNIFKDKYIPLIKE